MTVADKEMYFNYDAAGVPVSIVYNGTSYYYVTNLQGDVVGIVNQSGNQLVAYTYDAWGNVLTTTGSSAGSLGKYNPLRYRGYVYDTETKLYYLQSRYYNPEWGRFINADGLVSTGQGLLGNNMFAYCNNNPVNCSDYGGQVCRPYMVREEDDGVRYITDQYSTDVAFKSFGLTCVSHGGCGVVASYNALHTLGNPKSFDDVLAYYNNRMAFTLGWGFTGLSPSAVAGYFSDLGYSVMLTDDPDTIDLLSKTADACIMYYMFPQSYLGLDAYGAHFVEYHRDGSGYTGVNTNESGGRYSFSTPSDYATKHQRYYGIGIFIYK